MVKDQAAVVELLLRGATNREIARKLRTTEGAIKQRLYLLSQQTGMGSRFELAMSALNHPRRFGLAVKTCKDCGRVLI